MRIISGSLKGRQFQAPRGDRTHPMAEKVRGALFNVLGDTEGLSFLDAFAGSGALAFEAASRGAEFVLALDKDATAHKTIEQNINDLGLQKTVRVTKASAAGWSDNNAEIKFDIVLLDPPFDEIQVPLLETLIARHVREYGLAVLNFPGSRTPPRFANTKTAADKNYNDARLVFYRKL